MLDMQSAFHIDRNFGYNILVFFNRHIWPNPVKSNEKTQAIKIMLINTTFRFNIELWIRYSKAFVTPNWVTVILVHHHRRRAWVTSSRVTWPQGPAWCSGPMTKLTVSLVSMDHGNPMRQTITKSIRDKHIKSTHSTNSQKCSTHKIKQHRAYC